MKKWYNVTVWVLCLTITGIRAGGLRDIVTKIGATSGLSRRAVDQELGFYSQQEHEALDLAQEFSKAARETNRAAVAIDRAGLSTKDYEFVKQSLDDQLDMQNAEAKRYEEIAQSARAKINDLDKKRTRLSNFYRDLEQKRDYIGTLLTQQKQGLTAALEEQKERGRKIFYRTGLLQDKTVQ